ncbi:T9SS type A sorting domain-containing protein [Pollutibacter soli]|uniref:T9SS type A sorting domain-containing protein n=1 Tax=Pollutibacter soli TaxID=3034157 RepID=UPI003013400B
MFTLTKTLRASGLSVAILLASYGHAQTNTFDGSTNNNWSVAANWSQNRVPLATDNVVIPNGFTVSVNINAVCNSLTINGVNTVTIVSIVSTFNLNVEGAVTINNTATTSNRDHSIAIGAGTLTCESVSITNSTNDNRKSFITLTTGTLTVRGNIVLGSDPQRCFIQSTNAGTVNLGGSVTGGDIIMHAGSNFNYNGAAAQTANFSNGTEPYVYGNITFSNTSTEGVTLGAAVTGTNVLSNLTILSGTLNNGGFSISLGTNDDFAMKANTLLTLTGSTSFSVTGTGAVVDLDPASTIDFSGGDKNVPVCDYGNIKISAGGTRTLEGSINIFGTLEITGGTFETNWYFSGSRSVTMYGDFIHTGGDIYGYSILYSTTFYFEGNKSHNFTSGAANTVTGPQNFTVTAGDTLQAVSATTIIQGGVFTVQSGGTFGIRHAQGITGSGATGQVRTSARNYNSGANYIFNGSANQATGNGLTGANDLRIATTGNAAVTLTNTNVDVNGDLVISSGRFILSTRIITVAGNFVNDGTGFSANGYAPNGKVTFDGSGVQTIGGSSITTFNNIDINKTTGSLLLNQHAIISGTLNIGVNLDLSAYTLTMGASSPDIGTLGAGSFSSSKMIIATAGGELRKAMTSAGAFLFPVGENTGNSEYSPIHLSFTGGSYAGYVGVSVADEKHPNNGNITYYLTRYWSVNQSGLSGFSATVTSYYLDNDIIGSEYLISMAKWNGTEPWMEFASGMNYTANQMTAVVTSFSEFTGLDFLSPLPAGLINFTVLLSDKHSLLEWNTLAENQLSVFNVEYSSDGVHFNSIGYVHANNNPIGGSYSFRHLTPGSGKNYYRLKMIDVDQQFGYSPVIMLKVREGQNQLKAYPNPVYEMVTLPLGKAGRGSYIKITDMQGRMIRSISVPDGATIQQVNLKELNRGMYNIIFWNGRQDTVYRIQKY